MRVKFVLFALLASLFALFPTLALAGEFRTGETRVAIASGETVNDDLYISSGEVVVDGTVNGDVFAAGGQVRVNGRIAGDLFVAGGDINVAGTVGDDLRIAGGNISVGGQVEDDLLVLGGNVEVIESGEVLGDVRAGTGNLTIAGKTGSVHASLDTLTVASTARVNGDLRYASGNEAKIETGATITGKVTRESPARAGGFAQVLSGGGVFSLVTLLMALLFFYLLPNKSTRLAQDWRTRFWGNLLWGFLFLIAVPIAILILFVSLVGIPLAVGGLLVYPIFLYIGHLVSAIAFGTWIKNLWEKDREPVPSWLAVVLGVVALAILGFIPFLGWLAVFLIFLAGLGALVRFDWELIGKLRSGKTL